MIRRFAAGTAVATGLALSLTGCLGAATDKAGETGSKIQLTAAQVLGKAAEKTSTTDSFKASMSMQGSSKEGDMTMSGSMQYRTKPDIAYSMKFDQMVVAGQKMSGMESVLVDRTMYMKMTFLTDLFKQFGGGGGAAPATKPWIKISLDEVGAQAGINIDQLLEQSRQMDPVQNTKMLTASKDARLVGKENVEGVDTTHYTGTYSMADAMSKLTPEQQKALQKSAAQSGMDNMAFDLWVDDQQLPKKMVMKSAPGATEQMTMTMVYRDYGKPVQIAAPPADQVSDYSQMMKSLQPGMPRS
ncbi:LppX_LprAFG lipoprotein [Spirillospora sp. NPDC047279]|uniref:LppX_LprAFG lipoprotein n=1 Tax=Spirillospora sp. NPDC047279 TaxID=3155478 RepID=UPI0033D06091